MQQTWGDASHPARATLRPDGRWLLRLPDDAATWASLLAERPPVVDRIQVLTQDERGHRALRDLGFRAMRTEQRWLLPLAALEREAVKASDHEIRPVLGCDLERVTDLDNAVRRQIPGTEDWAGTVEDLRDSLDDDDFDPELYLIAVHRGSGSYDGLVRVWDRRPRPRLGCIGVTPGWRRTRLGSALLGVVVTVLRQRGVAEVTAETDLTNRDSHLLAARHGGIPQGRTVEWVLDD